MNWQRGRAGSSRCLHRRRSTDGCHRHGVSEVGAASPGGQAAESLPPVPPWASRLNMATFVNTWMEPEAQEVMQKVTPPGCYCMDAFM